jgi:zinc transport system permease protein
MPAVAYINFFEALFNNPFLLMAIFAGVAASIASGITGSFIVVKRIVFISGSIAHSVLGGMGFFLWLRRTYSVNFITPMQGAIIAALASALIMGYVRSRYKEREDTIIAALWSTGMALGVIFIALTPGYNVELMNFLFGNILWATSSDIIMLCVLDALILTMTFFFYKRFQALCFDEDQATLQGISVGKLYSLLLCMIALSIVLLIQVVGSILVIAILAIPAAIAGNLTSKLSKMMVLAVTFAIGFTLLGFYISYECNWPPGATISLTAALIYTAALLKKQKSSC